VSGLSHVDLLAGDPGASDAALLERFVGRRDPEAFAALVGRHGPMVLGLCKRLLRREQDAEDAFQATFLVLARRAPAIGSRDRLASWLYGVARKVAHRARTLATRAARPLGPDDEPAAPDGDEASRNELRRVLDEEVGRLPARYRAPVVLCHLEGRTNEEAARELSCPVGTVKGRLNRARDLLRRRLTRRGLAPSASVLVAALASQASALPPPLVTAAARGAAGVSSQAVALGEEVLRAMILTKWKVAAVLVLTLTGGLAGVLSLSGLAAEPKGDKEKIQGTWKVVSAMMNGKEPEGEEGEKIKKAHWVIGPDKIQVGDELKEATYTLDPTRKPPQIDVVSLVGGEDEKGKTFKGIYSLEGDTLKICATHPDAPRPTEFVSRAGGGEMLFTLKRVK
jgi:RNA polymerase sigma factor (sigma-70 family)